MRWYLLLLAIFAALILRLIVLDERAWATYLNDHHCRIVKTRRNQVTQGISITYACDAGETQIR